ncbi:MAG TPA: SMP-30/gluconolactonase/LRE family protein [Parvibaculum sp.]|jgi:arylesterase/paraoxonase
MSPVLRWTLIVVAVLFGIVSVLGWRFLAAAGYFTAIKQEVVAQCTTIPSPPGPEDIQIDRTRGMAFVAASDRRAAMAGNAAARGGIYTIDLTAPTDQWSLHPVTASEPADFHPHGISLYFGPDGVRRLFAVNHRAAGGHSIEIFDIAADGTLTHVKSITDPLLVSPNDVVAVGPESFYVTNDHGTSNRTSAMIDDLLLMRKADIVYYDGKTMRVSGGRLDFANGINISADGKSIYVSEFLGLALHVYKRDAATGDLTPTDYTPLGTGLDNIDVEEDGALLIAAHPKITAMIAHARDPKEISPSQVIRVELSPTGDGGRAGTIYLNLGEQISGASVAAGYRDLMLIGNVFDPKILVCKQSKEIRAF